MDQRSALGKVIKGLNFSSIPKYAPNIPENRPIETYIRKALQGDVDFYKEDKEKMGVVSSMDDLSGKVDKKIEEVDKKRKEVDKKIEDYQKRERILTVLSIISIIALLLTAVGMFITAGWYFKNAQELNEDSEKLEEYNETLVPSQDAFWQLRIDDIN